MSIVGLVAGKIGELLVQEIEFLYGVEGQVRSLQHELKMMGSFLIDMDDEEGADMRTRTAINEIRRIAYDAEDVIDSYILEANNKAERYSFFSTSLPRTHQVGSKIEAIKKRIVEAMERLKRYQIDNGVIQLDVGAGPSRRRWRRPKNHVFPQTSEEHVVGLEEDITKLVGVLTTTDGADIQILSIVGMGGSGKTTLTRKLYNHESVKKHFDCMVWESVSEEWVVEQVLLDLLKEASGQPMRKDEAWSLKDLVEKLHQHLEGRRYLIFLDDVWSKQALEKIFPALPNDGMKVIVTTRKREVASFPDLKCFTHEPRRLTEEESWELFRKIALLHKEQSNNAADIMVFESLAKEMLKKCGGLPLAVIALAGILGKKETIYEWETIKKAVSSRIVEEGRGTHSYGQVKEMLALSYIDLPPEIKPFFLYLSIFPEDHEIRTGELIRMWIAEGFITADMLQQGETSEDAAHNVVLGELIQRCVVQIARRNYEGKVKCIRLHDLVRDLCIKKAKEQEFMTFISQSSNSGARATELLKTEGLRRTAIYCFDRTYLPLPTQQHHLRCLVYRGERLLYPEHPVLNVQPIQENMRLLRVLILDGVHTPNGSLPSGIGNLIHLRYLGLECTNITHLPSSIGNLRNLLTFSCNQYTQGFRIPAALWKIEGLMHIKLPFTRISTLPESLYGKLPLTDHLGCVKLHALKQLQKLKGIIGGRWMLRELPRLSKTVQQLNIESIGTKEQLKAVMRCPSILSGTLVSLSLDWYEEKSGRERVVMLENLKPIMNCILLKKLRLWGKIGERLSSCNKFPDSIVILKLRHTGFEEAELVALGELPNLKLLYLSEDAYKGDKWTWIAGQFTKLKELSLLQIHEWEEWSIETGAMPQLTKLSVLSCGKLRRFPEGLKSITTLQELHIRSSELERRIKGGGEDGDVGEDAHIVKHVPLIDIR